MGDRYLSPFPGWSSGVRVTGRPPQIAEAHLRRKGVVYIRQSSMEQVRENVGSTALQRDLPQILLAWGWRPERGMYTERLAPTTLTRGPGPGAGPSASSPLVSWQCLPDTVEPRGPQGMK
jgi:hypothetical protein